MTAVQPKLRILVVENEMLLQLAAEAMLTELGCEVVGCVGSSRAAVAEADRTRPDLVLMDIELDGAGDGIDAAHQITTRFGIASLFMTGAADDHTRQRALVTCPLGFLAKPFTVAELRGALAQLHRAPGEGVLPPAMLPRIAVVKHTDDQ